MDLNSVRIFVDVIQSGSFSATSKRLGIPIPTVSRRIYELEKNLEIQLLERLNSGVRPTITGQKLYEQVHLNINQILEAKRLILTDEVLLKGNIRISTPPSFFPAWSLVAKFQEKFPDIKIHFHVTDRLVNLIEDGIDVTFRMNNLHTESLIAQKIMEISPKLVATLKFIDIHGQPKNLVDLTNFPCAGWSKMSIESSVWFINDEKLEVPCQFTSNDLESISYIVSKHLALGFVPDYIADPKIESGEWIELLENTKHQKNPVYILYPAHKNPSTIVKTFINFCKNHSFN
nr:LysR family transcriptional regulator [Acinetobacter sp. Marseille-Q1620]